jgi:hypothetical protein
VTALTRPGNSLTYSFLPNLVWLPAQLAKLTDREGGFAQTLLQTISLALYRHVALTPRLATIVRPIWDALPVRDEVAEISVQLDRLSFFEFGHAWLERRRRKLAAVEHALGLAGTNAPSGPKVVSTRYGGGIPSLNSSAVADLRATLRAYEEAVDEAATLGNFSPSDAAHPLSIPLGVVGRGTRASPARRSAYP